MSYGGAVNSYMREEGERKKRKRKGFGEEIVQWARRRRRRRLRRSFVLQLTLTLLLVLRYRFLLYVALPPLASLYLWLKQRGKGGPLKIAAIARSLDRRQSINQYLMMKMAAALMTMPPKSIDAGHALQNTKQYAVPPFSKQKRTKTLNQALTFCPCS